MKEKIIDAGTYHIIINNDGIFTITKARKLSHERLSGRFRMVKYFHESDTFIIKINKAFYYGDINRLLNFSWSFRYTGSAPVLRFIFETYKQKKLEGLSNGRY